MLTLMKAVINAEESVSNESHVIVEYLDDQNNDAHVQEYCLSVEITDAILQ